MVVALCCSDATLYIKGIAHKESLEKTLEKKTNGKTKIGIIFSLSFCQGKNKNK